MKSEQELLDQMTVKGQALADALAKVIAQKAHELDHMRERHATFCAGLAANGVPKGRTLKFGAVQTLTPKKAKTVVAGVTVPAASLRPPRAVKAKSPSSGIDWAGVLATLPRRFGAKLVPVPRGASPQARTMAIARWMRFGKIEKVGPGDYRKIGPGSRAVPGRAAPVDQGALAQL